MKNALQYYIRKQPTGMHAHCTLHMSTLICFVIAIFIQLGQLLFLVVSFVVKPEKEDPIEAAVEHEDEVEAGGEAAGGVEEGHDPVEDHHQELDHLHAGQVPLPPQVLLKPETKKCQRNFCHNSPKNTNDYKW